MTMLREKGQEWKKAGIRYITEYSKEYYKTIRFFLPNVCIRTSILLNRFGSIFITELLDAYFVQDEIMTASNQQRISKF